jgi:hypothetical protein
VLTERWNNDWLRLTGDDLVTREFVDFGGCCDA